MAETIPGGYYIGEDGTPHDAWGRPLVNGEPVTVPDGEVEPLFPEGLPVRANAPVAAPVEVKALKERRRK